MRLDEGIYSDQHTEIIDNHESIDEWTDDLREIVKANNHDRNVNVYTTAVAAQSIHSSLRRLSESIEHIRNQQYFLLQRLDRIEARMDDVLPTRQTDAPQSAEEPPPQS